MKYFLIAVILFFLSCSMGVRTRSFFGGKLSVEVVSASDANQDNPIAVDIVYVYNDKLLKDIVKLSAEEWFQKKEQIRNDFFPEKVFDSWSWEWIPGQNVPLIKLPLKASAKAGFVFTGYVTKGKHRFRFNPHKSIRIRLENEITKLELLK